jgi:hypothetical protein
MSGALDLIQANQAAQASRPQSQPTPQPAPVQPQVRADRPWQPAADAQPVSVGWTQGAGQQGSGVSLSDYAKEAWASGQQMGAGILGAASWTARQLGASPDVIQHIEQAKSAIIDHAAGTVASMSPDAQRAAHASIFGGTDENGEHVPTPGEVGWARYLGMTAASFVPDALAAIVPGSIGARLGMRIAGEVGSMVSRTAATGGTFGTIQLGDAYNQFVKDVDQSKPEDWKNSPAMQQMLASGTSFDDAKKSIVQQGMTQLGALQFGCAFQWMVNANSSRS